MSIHPKADEIKALLTKYPQLFAAYLEMRNDLIQFNHILLRIRELLGHEMNDLREIVGISSQQREALSISQKIYGPHHKIYKSQLEPRMVHAIGRLDTHIKQVSAKIIGLDHLIPDFSGDLSTMVISLNKLLEYPSHDIGPLASLLRLMNDRVHRMLDTYKDLTAEFKEQLKPYLSEFAGFVKNHQPEPSLDPLAIEFTKELDYFRNELFEEITLAAQYSEGIRQKYKELANQFAKTQAELELEQKLGLNLDKNKHENTAPNHHAPTPRPNPFKGINALAE